MGVVTPNHRPASLGDWIDARCAELGLGYAELADRIGRSPQALLGIRTGKTKPRHTTARAIERALDWESGSVEAILRSGDAPTVIAPAEAVVRMSVDDLADAFAELAKEKSDQELLEIMAQVMRLRSRPDTTRTRDAG